MHFSHSHPAAQAFAARAHGCGPAFARGGDSGPFGVRRPLRFLADKLGLDEAQAVELAAVLDDLKTERAQAAVDDRRVLSAWADGLAAETFDADRFTRAAKDRVASAERLQTAVTRALSRMHGILRPEQRARLAYLIRTGALVL
jgi:Spy/CpxP family protein refolding chaperone